MSLVLENVMKIENVQIFHCMQSFNDIHTTFSFCDGEQVFCTFPKNSLYVVKRTQIWTFSSLEDEKMKIPQKHGNNKKFQK